MNQPQFSVIVPCYNEEAAIRETVAALRRALPDPETYELIVVNDGSTDRSAKILSELEREDAHLRVEHHPRNRGYGAALKTGIQRAHSELIVITDADGTYPNERIAELVAVARDADMVVGARTADDAVYPLIRKIPKAFLRTYASWLARRRIPDLNSGMRVFRRSVAQHFLRILPDGFSFTTTITLAMLTNFHDVRYIPIGYAHRKGRSKIRPIRDTVRFVQLIVRTGTYFAPMRVFFPFALVLFGAFILSALYDVFFLNNLTDKTILFFLFAMNTGMFALLADMIDKRSN
ncbi:MAG: glycosyltransferase family 2 protein [Phycisphaerae bacterium]|jgi:glycosyltransferase involved in cell wall biosynthesis